jgi:NAD(P)H-dependent FMN reductase
MPFRGKSALLIAASDSSAGGIRGLWQLRIPLEGLGVVVYPDMFYLPHALSAFDDNGSLNDPKATERLGGMIRGYVEMAGKLAGKTA